MNEYFSFSFLISKMSPSWGKTDLIEIILPKLSKEQINAQCPDGKTALHWAVEMASVSAVKKLVSLKEVDQNFRTKEELPKISPIRVKAT